MPSRRTFIASSAVFLAACAAPNSAAPSLSGSAEIGKLSDVAVGTGKVFEVQGLRILITRPTETEFRAFEAKCTHQGGALDGVTNGEIICPLHGAKFDPATGEVLAGPAESALTVFKVELADDQDTLVLSS